MYTININDLKYLAVFFLAFKSYDNKQILNSVECITKNNLDVHYYIFVYSDDERWSRVPEKPEKLKKIQDQLTNKVEKQFLSIFISKFCFPALGK